MEEKGFAADADMVAGCVNGVPVLKMPRALAEALGFAVTPVKEHEDSKGLWPGNHLRITHAKRPHAGALPGRGGHGLTSSQRRTTWEPSR